ncbi:MAG: HAMP domain-containing protein [Deltaproteobacteria bacterium]|nr:HAMP domain-containing protein [Deltaproteobacteria bacterium]
MATAAGPLRNLHIRAKILLGFAAVIGLVALGNLYGILSVGTIARNSVFAGEVAFRKVARLSEMEILAKRTTDSAGLAVDAGVPEKLSEAKALGDELGRKLTAARAEFGDPELGRQLDDLRRRLGDHLQQADGVFKLAADQRWEAFGAPRKALQEHQEDLVRRIAALKGASVADLEGSLASIAQLTKKTAWSIAGVTVLALVLALAISVSLSAGIVRPLQRLLTMMKAAQGGDFSVRAEVGTGDETGALSQGFNEMLQDLEHHRNHLQELVQERTWELEAARGKLEMELEVRQITESARAESEGLLRSVLNSVHAGILIVDAARGDIVEANRFALDCIGARRDEVVGRRSDSYLLPALQAALASGATENFPGQLGKLDGSHLPILRCIVPITHQGRAHVVESFIATPERAA